MIKIIDYRDDGIENIINVGKTYNQTFETKKDKVIKDLKETKEVEIDNNFDFLNYNKKIVVAINLKKVKM